MEEVPGSFRRAVLIFSFALAAKPRIDSSPVYCQDLTHVLRTRPVCVKVGAPSRGISAVVVQCLQCALDHVGPFKV